MANKVTTKNKVVKKKIKKNVPVGNVYVLSTFNNTKITLTDLSGNVVCWSTCGAIGFKGTKKSTAFAATKAAEDLYQKATKSNVEEINVFVKGIGQGRVASIKGLRTAGFVIKNITDITPIPHGGVRTKKLRKS